MLLEDRWFELIIIIYVCVTAGGGTKQLVFSIPTDVTLQCMVTHIELAGMFLVTGTEKPLPRCTARRPRDTRAHYFCLSVVGLCMPQEHMIERGKVAWTSSGCILHAFSFSKITLYIMVPSWEKQSIILVNIKNYYQFFESKQFSKIKLDFLENHFDSFLKKIIILIDSWIIVKVWLPPLWLLWRHASQICLRK